MLRYFAFGTPILLVALGMPLLLKMVPPNNYFGYRTSQTLASAEVWYSVNWATGLAMICAGLLGILTLFLSSEFVGLVDLRPENRVLLGILMTALFTLAALIPVVFYADRLS